VPDNRTFAFKERLTLRGVDLVPGATLVLELHRQRVKVRACFNSGP
jgi:hypothetical protein